MRSAGENAESPFSRVRVFFAKRGSMCFMGHLDLVRVIPRMLRRAGLEIGFTRGFNPTPRMSFGPALPLGMAAREEVVDLDVILPDSASDMTGGWSDERRAEVGRALTERLRGVAPSGLRIVELRLLSPDERKAGALVAGADYAVALDDDAVARVRARIDAKLAAEQIVVTRAVRPKKGRRRGPGGEDILEIDIRPTIVDAALDEANRLLRLRLRLSSDVVSARPREVVEALVGEAVPDVQFCRERLLTRDGDGYAPLRGASA